MLDQHPTPGHGNAAHPAEPAGEAGHAHSAYPVYVAEPPGRFAAFMLRMYSRFPRWTAPVAILACFAGAAGFVLVREPVDGAFDETTCIAKLTTGFDCPGCGGTRAFFYLLQGNVPAAARHHLLLVFAAPFLAYMFTAWATGLVFGWRLPQLRPGPTMISIFLVAGGVFSVLRNLPWAPFTWFYV